MNEAWNCDRERVKKSELVIWEEIDQRVGNERRKSECSSQNRHWDWLLWGKLLVVEEQMESRMGIRELMKYLKDCQDSRRYGQLFLRIWWDELCWSFSISNLKYLDVWDILVMIDLLGRPVFHEKQWIMPDVWLVSED
jgi:hypothetical protein